MQDGESNNNNGISIIKTEATGSSTQPTDIIPKPTRNKRHHRDVKDFSTSEAVPRKFSLNNHLLMIAPNQLPKAICDDAIKKEVSDDVFLPSTVEHPMQQHQFQSYLYNKNGQPRQLNPLPSFHYDVGPSVGLLQRQNSLSIQVDGKCNVEGTTNCKPNANFQGQLKATQLKLGRGKRKSRNSHTSDDNIKKM